MPEKSGSVDHSRRDVLRLAAVSAVGLAMPGGLAVASDAPVARGVSGPMKSAGVLTFGPSNVLFVGDIVGSKVHAFALRDKDLTSQTDVISGKLGYLFDSSCPNMLWFSLVPRTSNDAFVGFRYDSNSLLKQAIEHLAPRT